jgi:hypothetical protein
MTAAPAASFLSWGCQSTAPCRAQRRGASRPLHRHKPCASALSLLRPARSARSRQPVGSLAASCAAVQGSARPPAPSVLVVPPDFDGLLRASPCGLVASRSRPWGSSRFQTPAADREWDMGISHAIRGASARDPFPGTHDPSKRFPCTQPSSGCGATEIAPSPFVDARLTDHSAPPEARLLWAPRLASWPFTVGPTLSPLSLHLCSTAHAATLSNRSPCEPKLQTAVLANRSSSELASAARLAQPLDLRVSRHIQIRCTDTVFPPCPCPMLPWAFCSAHTVHEDLGTSEEV